MSQNYQKINLTDKMYDSLPKILERDDASATAFSGNNYPQEIEDWMKGLICLRLDLKQLNYLSSLDPVRWDTIVDFSQELATLDFVQTNYQPLHSVLTAFSSLPFAKNQLPYFNSNTTMSTLPITNFGKRIMNTENAETARELLELGNLSTKDKITSDDIVNGSITENKLAYTPIKEKDGYTIGDIKESFNSDIEEGYILMKNDISIGAEGSGATYTGDEFQSLFMKLWILDSVIMLDSSGNQIGKATTATGDWGAKRRLVLPKYMNYFNPTAFYKIRYK